MNIFNSSDIELLNDKSVMILAETKKLENIMLEPTMSQILKIKEDIINFCKKKKLKIYGGYGLNQLLIDKNPEDGFYSELDRPDIDIYSPSPIEDMIELCNILYKNGNKRVIGKEAVHDGTYVIFVEYEEQCNFTYVPKIIYDRLPFKTIKNLNITHPLWIMIDYFRIFTDPIMSFRLLIRSFNRFFLLQKHYPFPINNKKIQLNKQPDNILDIFDSVYDFITNNNNCILIGYYAYNHFAKTVDMKELLINPPIIELILANYETDGKKLLLLLQKKFQNITLKEYYPFFQFYGYNAIIYVNNISVVHIYNNNDRCVPYIEVPLFHEKKNKYVCIGSFDTQIMYMLSFIMQNRVLKNNTDIYFVMINNLLKMKNNYLKTKNKTIFDESIFQGFITKCIGKPLNPKRKKRLLADFRRKNKIKTEYIYDPTIGGKKPNYQFQNISGNEIKNIKNNRIGKEVVNIDDEPDDESDNILVNKQSELNEVDEFN